MRIILQKYVVTCVGAVLLFVSVADAQQKMRSVNAAKYKKTNEPLQISYELGDQPFLNGTETPASPEWLKNLTLSVKNISQKTIVYFYIELVIEKQGTMEYRNAVTLSFPGPGKPVFDEFGNPTGKYKAPVLKPGETVKVKPPENQLLILDDLKKQEVPEIDSVSLDIRYVFYEDGTRWMLGYELRPDPDNKDKWIRVRPDKPKPTVSQRFSIWLSSFAFKNAVTNPSMNLPSCFRRGAGYRRTSFIAASNISTLRFARFTSG